MNSRTKRFLPRKIERKKHPDYTKLEEFDSIIRDAFEMGRKLSSKRAADNRAEKYLPCAYQGQTEKKRREVLRRSLADIMPRFIEKYKGQIDPYEAMLSWIELNAPMVVSYTKLEQRYHVLFGAAFLLGAKKTLARRIAGACVLLPGIVLLVVFRSHPAVKGNIAEMAVYTAALAFMVASSFGQGRLIRAGAVLLAATGVTVFCGLAAGASWMTHAAGLALYYSGMVCLSLGTLDGMKVPVLSDRAQRKKQLKKERDADKLG